MPTVEAQFEARLLKRQNAFHLSILQATHQSFKRSLCSCCLLSEKFKQFAALKDMISSRDEAKRIAALDVEWKID
jgi:hypothetical protein